MDTNNVAFKFSPSLLPIVVHELVSNLDFILCIFSFNLHNLGRLWGITEDLATIPFHLVLFSAAPVKLAKSIPVHSLICFSISSSRYLFFFFLLLAHLYEVKEHLSDTPGVHALELVLARDQNVRFMHLGQFLSNYKG